MLPLTEGENKIAECYSLKPTLMFAQTGFFYTYSNIYFTNVPHYLHFNIACIKAHCVLAVYSEYYTVYGLVCSLNVLEK